MLMSFHTWRVYSGVIPCKNWWSPEQTIYRTNQSGKYPLKLYTPVDQMSEKTQYFS